MMRNYVEWGAWVLVAAIFLVLAVGSSTAEERKVRNGWDETLPSRHCRQMDEYMTRCSYEFETCYIFRHYPAGGVSCVPAAPE